MGRLRSKETDEAYTKLKQSGALAEGCPLCTTPSIREFDRWRIIGNRFPYDSIAAVHHMLAPKRHVPESGLTAEEKEEFESIKNGYVSDTYEFTMEAVLRRKSIPDHAHTHLIVENPTYD
jgi:hypothetical protein